MSKRAYSCTLREGHQSTLLSQLLKKKYYQTSCRETRETVLPICSLKGDTAPCPAKAEKTLLLKEKPFPNSQWISEKHTALLSSTEDQNITVRLALGNGFTICLFGSKSLS